MLIAYEVALELIRKLRPIVEQVRFHNNECAQQLHDAASNCVHNLGEGQRKRDGNKRLAYERAHGEAREVLAALDVAAAWGWCIDDREARAVLDRLLALCWGLTHGPAKARRPTWDSAR